MHLQSKPVKSLEHCPLPTFKNSIKPSVLSDRGHQRNPLKSTLIHHFAAVSVFLSVFLLHNTLQLREALGFPTCMTQADNEWKQCACNETRFAAHTLFCQLTNCPIISGGTILRPPVYHKFYLSVDETAQPVYDPLS